MENSMNSITRKTPSFNDRKNNELEEETSSWTMYFEDFFTNMNNNDDQCCDNEYSDNENNISVSLISDAASFIDTATEKKDYGLKAVGILDKRLSFKKRKTKANSDLEDTATSPAHSPKVCSIMNQSGKNPKQKDISFITQMEKGGVSSSQVINEERNDDRENDSTELKKRGLCLVPLSMVAMLNLEDQNTFLH